MTRQMTARSSSGSGDAVTQVTGSLIVAHKYAWDIEKKVVKGVTRVTAVTREPRPVPPP